MSKPKICKCGHNRDKHFKKYLHYESCDKCPCDDYLRRDKPHLGDKIFAVYGVIMIVVLWGTFGATWWMINDLNNLEGEENIDMTSNEFGELMLIMLFGFFLFFTILTLPFIPEYFREKRRRTYPEDE